MQLRITQGTNAGQVFPLQPGATTLGRSAENQIVLSDQTVSRHHARIEARGSQLFISDLGTANGTYVNSQLVRESQPIHPGDIIQMGAILLTLDAAGAPAGVRPAGVPAAPAPNSSSTRPALPIVAPGPAAAPYAAPPAPRRSPLLPLLAIGGLAALMVVVLLIAVATRAQPNPGATANDPVAAAAITLTAVMNPSPSAFATQGASQVAPTRVNTAPAAAPTAQSAASAAPATPAATVQGAAVAPTATRRLSPAATPRRLKASTYLANTRRTGLGKLTVKNDFDQDLVAILTFNNATAISVYVLAGTPFIIDRIADGEYRLFYTYGTDWDETKFTRDAQYFAFDVGLSFKTQSVQGGKQFTTYDVTLNPNIGGVKPVPAGEFPRVK